MYVYVMFSAFLNHTFTQFPIESHGKYSTCAKIGIWKVAITSVTEDYSTVDCRGPLVVKNVLAL